MTIYDDIAKLNRITGLDVTEQTWPVQRFFVPNALDIAILQVRLVQQPEGNCVWLTVYEDCDPTDKTPLMNGGPKMLNVTSALIRNGRIKASLDRNGGVRTGQILFRINPVSLLNRIAELGFVREPDRKDIRKQFLQPAPTPA